MAVFKVGQTPLATKERIIKDFANIDHLSEMGQYIISLIKNNCIDVLYLLYAKHKSKSNDKN